jgi:hypothetical protein
MLTVTPVGVPSDAMRLKDRILLHEVHPVKLVTDIGSGVLCLYFLWEHSLSLAILFAAVPPLLASGLVLRFADLTALERTMLGNYLRRYMTPTMQALRLCGFLAMAIGAWYHSPLMLVVGLGIVAFGWLKGIIFA